MRKNFYLLILFLSAQIYGLTEPTDADAFENTKSEATIIYDVTELSPVDDAYIQGSTAYNNSLLRLEEGNRTSYLKFNLGSINGTITKVELSLIISVDSGSGTITVYNGDTSSWTESTLTTSNAPAEVSALGTIDAGGSTHLIDLSVANLQIYSGDLSLILKHTGTDDLAHASQENSNTAIRPKLIVTFTPNTGDTTPPTAPTLTHTSSTENTATLSWSGATDNIGITGFKLFQNGTEIPNIGNVTNYQVTSLTAQTTYNFTVTALDAQGNESPTSNTVSVTTNSTPPTTTSIFVNAGGAAQSHDGKQFIADQYFTGGNSYTNTSALVPALYQTEHSGSARNYSYNIPIDNGTYDVNLHFAEIYWGATGGATGGIGKRIFDVSIEGNLVLDNYDIYADVGPETPVVKTFSITITDGEINLNFSSLSADGGVDQVKLSALEINTAGANTSGAWVSNGSDIYVSGSKVGIGTTTPDYALTVKGKIHAEEVRIDLSVSAPDYVFKPDYDLKSLKEIQEHIDQYGHLPNIPSAPEMEANGVELGSLEMKLLEKIEELTLYLLKQNNSLNALKLKKQLLKRQTIELIKKIEYL